MTTCPSGVNYMHLVDHARTYIEETYEPPLARAGVRRVLSQVLPYPARFRAGAPGARLGRPLAGLVPGRSMAAAAAAGDADAWRRRAAAGQPDAGAAGAQGRGPRRGRVALLTGCAQQVLAPSINEATIRLLTRSGSRW